MARPEFLYLGLPSSVSKQAIFEHPCAHKVNKSRRDWTTRQTTFHYYRVTVVASARTKVMPCSSLGNMLIGSMIWTRFYTILYVTMYWLLNCGQFIVLQSVDTITTCLLHFYEEKQNWLIIVSHLTSWHFQPTKTCLIWIPHANIFGVQRFIMQQTIQSDAGTWCSSGGYPLKSYV